MKNAQQKNFLLDFLRVHMEIMVLCASGGHLEELKTLITQKKDLQNLIQKYGN